MIVLDMRTIVFSHAVTDIVSLLVILSLWYQSRKRFAGTGFWVLDFAFQTAAVFLISLRGSIPDWMSMVVANTLVIGGAILGYMGLVRFVGKKNSQVHNYVLLVAFVCVHAYFTLFQPNQAARNLNVTVGLLFVCFQCMWFLMYRVEPQMRQLTRGAGMVFGAYSLVSIVRIVGVFNGTQPTKDFFQSGVFESLILISYQMLFILLTYSLVLMVNKRLIEDVGTQEEKFAIAFRSSPYAVTLTRLTDGQIIELNDGFVNITGYQYAEALGKTTLDLHLWNREEDRVMAVNELSKKGRVHGREFQFRKKSGETLTGIFSAEIISINGEGFVLSSVNDVTERKRAEQALQEAYDELELRVQERTAELNKTTEALSAERQRFQNALDQLPAYLILLSPDYRVPLANRFFEERFGKSGGRCCYEYLFNRNAPCENCETYSVLKTNAPHRWEWTGPDGCNYDIYDFPFADVDGSPLIMEVGLDITERKKAVAELARHRERLEELVSERTGRLETVNEELQAARLAAINLMEDALDSQKELQQVNAMLSESEKRLSRAQEIAHLGSWELDLEKDQLTWSDEVYRIFGLEPQGFGATYEAFLEAVHPDDRAAVDAAYSGSIRDGRDSYEIEHRVVRPSSGEIRVVHEKCDHFRDEAGRIVRSIGIAHDVTERRKAEEALQRAHNELESRVQERTKELEVTNRELSNEIIERKEVERQLLIQAAAMEAAANGIVITDPLGNILWMNQAVTQMTGYTNDELVGQNTRVFRSGRHDAGFYHQMWETILEGEVWHGQMTNRRKDGNLYIEEQTITPVLSESGQISQFISIKQDVTERQLIYAQLEQSNRELQAISTLEHQQRLISEVLSKASVALSQTLDIERVMETVLDYIQLVLPLDVAFVVLSEGNDRYGIRSVRSSGQHDLAGALLNQSFDLLSDPMIRPFFEKQTSTLIPDTDAFETWKPSGELASMHTWLGIPLISTSQIIGMVVSANRKPNSFRDDQIKLAEAVVGQATVALQNAWLFEQVRAGRERLQYLSRRLVETQESERRFIARELHDQAGQSLSSLILGLGQVERDADKPGKIQARVGKLKALTNDILEDLHRLAVNLRPASLDHLGLVPALDQFIKSFADRSHLKIHFKAVGISESDRLPTDVETTLYRIVQEALTNVARHAQASHADIILERRTASLLLIVEDNGTGFDPQLPRTDTHLGLLGMHERAETLGGSLTIESVPGQGTTLVVEVPDVDPDPTGG